MATRKKTKKTTAKRGAKRGTKGARAKAGRSSTPRRSSKSRGAGATDIRTRIDAFTRKAVRDGGAALREFPRFTKKVLADAAKAVDESVPSAKDNVLRKVVDSLAEAGAATAHSVRGAINSSAERGSTFVRKDLPRTVKDLRAFEGVFIASLDHARKSFTGAAKDEMATIVAHAKKAGTRIGPAAQSAVKAADGRLIELGGETAKAGFRVTRRAVGGILNSASGLLSALGDAARGK